MSAPERRGARMPLARHRLQRSDFQRVYKHGRRARGAIFGVVVLENGLGRSRVGLSIAKRHVKRAVDRNKVRRVLRESFRLELAALPAGLDVVLVSHTPLRAPRLVEARAELLALVARALSKRPRAPARAAAGGTARGTAAGTAPGPAPAAGEGAP